MTEFYVIEEIARMTVWFKLSSYNLRVGFNTVRSGSCECNEFNDSLITSCLCLAKGPNAIHLVKIYCLPTLTYGCENAVFCENIKRKINVTWNYSFIKNFNCCWRESVKQLKYFCGALPMTCHIDQNKLLFWKRCTPAIT